MTAPAVDLDGSCSRIGVRVKRCSAVRVTAVPRLTACPFQAGGDPVGVGSLGQTRVAVLEAQPDELELLLGVWTPDREHAEVVAQLGVDHVVVEHVAQVEQHRPAVPADAVKHVRRVARDEIGPRRAKA